RSRHTTCYRDWSSDVCSSDLDARLREPHLRRGRELLAHAAHPLRRRPCGDVLAVGEDHVVGAEEREVIRDRGTDGAGAGDDYATIGRASCRDRGNMAGCGADG